MGCKGLWLVGGLWGRARAPVMVSRLQCYALKRLLLHSHLLTHLISAYSTTNRDAEDELVSVAEEKERLAPQVEEAKWRARQLEKELGETQVGGCVAWWVSWSVGQWQGRGLVPLKEAWRQHKNREVMGGFAGCYWGLERLGGHLE